MSAYDYLIVGGGLFGATFAQRANESGKKCLVLEKREHMAGNAYTREIEGIQVHQYGAHIFHTNSPAVWNYVNKFAEFNRFTNSPIVNYRGEIYNLPFNMNTFNKLWGVITPEEARQELERQRKECYTKNPKNLEQTALNLVGRDIYEKLIRGYTEKQWGRPCTELPASIILRLPVRYAYDNNYFDALFQGIPVGGYTAMVERMLQGIEVHLQIDYLEDKQLNNKIADTIIYTGPIDAYFDYCLGPLEYRNIRFETKILETRNFQGNAVVNYTDQYIPYTRIIEHKHLVFGKQNKTIISYEYSSEWKPEYERFYPIEDKKNSVLYEHYRAFAKHEKNIFFGGRLGMYKYYNMDQVIEQALLLFDRVELQK
jgi:UDP-galactopyranose mutase